jgi:hypothetical protein
MGLANPAEANPNASVTTYATPITQRADADQTPSRFIDVIAMAASVSSRALRMVRHQLSIEDIHPSHLDTNKLTVAVYFSTRPATPQPRQFLPHPAAALVF